MLIELKQATNPQTGELCWASSIPSKPNVQPCYGRTLARAVKGLIGREHLEAAVVKEGYERKDSDNEIEEHNT